MRIVSKLIVALVIGAAAAFFANFDAPPAKLIVFAGVTLIAFFAIPTSKKK